MHQLLSSLLSEMPSVGAWQQRFLEQLFPAILATHGRVTFRNLARHSGLHEKTYSRQFGQPFDFVEFNRRLIDTTLTAGSERVCAFDASFIKKAGKRSHGLGYYYNGCAGRPEKGLEISTLAIVDLDCRTAFTLSARQSEPLAKKKSQLDQQTMVDHYLEHIESVRPQLQPGETTLVLDGYFAKDKVFDALDRLGLQAITRLRKDANMRYLYEGPKRPSGSGRQKVYDGKVDWRDLSRFNYLGDFDGIHVYSKILNHPHFQRNLRVVVLVNPKKPGDYILLAATDSNLNGITIWRYYSARFQIEFTYRDGKQFTGLADCQARDRNRLHFHFNAALTALNLAQAEQIKLSNSQTPFVFSMRSVKARYFNQQWMQLFFSKLGLDPELIKKDPAYQQLCNYGSIAA